MPKRAAVKAIEQPPGHLSPDERKRFLAEARDTYHHNADFDWQDAIGRKWWIRTGVTDNRGVILIQASRGDTFRERQVLHGHYTDEWAEQSIDRIDTDEVW